MRRIWTALALTLTAGACATPAAPPASPASPAPKRTAYLPADVRVDGLRLAPPPPAEGSAALASDEAAATANLALRDSPRWALATQDADLGLASAGRTFACALGAQLSAETTPRMHTLLRRSMADLASSTVSVKVKYKRPRPFMVNGQPTCTPTSEKGLRHDGSYPSGHSAIGWGWALILAEAAPDRASEILARGRAFGESRAVCNVHWRKDTEEGRLLASSTVALMHAQPEFIADMAVAREEIRALRARGLPLAADCAAESEILKNG